MDARVAAIERSWTRPEIKIDVKQLRHEQIDRSSWLARALERGGAAEHTWEEVLAAITTLESQIGT